MLFSAKTLKENKCYGKGFYSHKSLYVQKAYRNEAYTNRSGSQVGHKNMIIMYLWVN